METSSKNHPSPKTTRSERSSSLTWGLEWDRNSILPAAAATVSASSSLQAQPSTFTFSPNLNDSSTSRMMRAFSADDSGKGSTSMLSLDARPFTPKAGGESFSVMSPQQQQRQRATSDAAAVKAAWGANPDSPQNYVSSLPTPIRRTHSANEPNSVWDSVHFSPNHQHGSGEARATSVGSPSWSQASLPGNGGEEDVYLFDEDAQFQHQSFPMSPMQHKLQPGGGGLASSPRFSIPPPPVFIAPNQTPMTVGGVHADEQQLLFDAQVQNMQHMQQQWVHMVQMQLDQTLLLTEQRFTQMSMQQQHEPQVPPTPQSPQPRQMRSPKIPPPIMYRTQNPSTMNGGSPRRPSHSQQPQASSTLSSSLLAEHKVTGRHPTSQELVGHVVEFSRDSHGSRLIQSKMETGTMEEKLQYVTEALPYTLSLARDLFGNYVVQNFFDNADTVEQRDALAAALLGSINSLCTHPHGCRVVQRALFAVSSTRRNDLIQELLEITNSSTHVSITYQSSTTTEHLIKSHSRDAHATHVVQKAVCALQRGVGIKPSFKDVDFKEGMDLDLNEQQRSWAFLEIIEACVVRDVLGMSTHQQACRLVQKVLASCEQPSKRVQTILHQVFQNIDMLAIHQNGNFVLQHLLECTEPTLASRVQQFVCTNGVRLARHKFGSHLVEKALSCATQTQVNCIIERFLAPLLPGEDGNGGGMATADVQEDLQLGLIPSALPGLMKDPYANFVVQKAFDVSRGDTRHRLQQEIRARTASLSKFSYGRHILTHINRANNNSTG
ncbi:hypothetical protein BASA81_003786 [Batrachochytrium salamandrivorans]|nr:hypothetical protein BASA81_003786 [Batrachochytrium salamandrivorans]